MKVLLIGLADDRTDNEVVRGLHATGIEVHVVGPPGSRGQAFCREQGVLHREHSFRSRVDPAAVRLIRNLVREHDYEILHCYTNRALSNALLATRGSPVKVIGYRGTMGHLSRWDPASWMTYLHPRVSRIICVSHAVEGYLKQAGVAPERLRTIHKGHDPDWYHREQPVSLAEFGLPDNSMVAGFVGNMRPVKGADVLLEAVRHLPASSPLQLLMVGEVRDRRIATLAADPEIAPRVHLAGFRTDAPALAGACRFLVMPSVDREGLPRALLEGMSQGVPAIVSEVGGMPELIEHEVSGLIVPARDPRALAEAMQRLMDDGEECERMGRAARARIDGPFHVRRTLEKTLAVYREWVPSRS